MGKPRRGGGNPNGKDKDKNKNKKRKNEPKSAPERPAPESPRMGPGARIVGMVVNPVATLEEVIRAPRALGAVAILLGTNLLLVMTLWDRIHAHALWLVEHAPPANVPPEDLGLFADQVPVMSAAEALIGPAITWLMMALLLRLLGSGSGRVLTFGLLFNVVIFGMVPHMLGLYVESGLRFLLDPARPDFLSVSFSLAYLIPGSEYNNLFPLLNAFRPFTIWGLVLVSIGGAKVLDTKLPRVLVPVLGLWFLLAAVQMFTYTGPGI